MRHCQDFRLIQLEIDRWFRSDRATRRNDSTSSFGSVAVADWFSFPPEILTVSRINGQDTAPEALLLFSPKTEKVRTRIPILQPRPPRIRRQAHNCRYRRRSSG